MERGIGQWWSVNGAIIDVEGEWITPEMEPQIPYQKEGAGELPSWILQENKRPADIREPGRRVESGGVLFAIKIIEEDLVREPAD